MSSLEVPGCQHDEDLPLDPISVRLSFDEKMKVVDRRSFLRTLNRSSDDDVEACVHKGEHSIAIELSLYSLQPTSEHERLLYYTTYNAISFSLARCALRSRTWQLRPYFMTAVGPFSTEELVNTNFSDQLASRITYYNDYSEK